MCCFFKLSIVHFHRISLISVAKSDLLIQPHHHLPHPQVEVHHREQFHPINHLRLKSLVARYLVRTRISKIRKINSSIRSFIQNLTLNNVNLLKLTCNCLSLNRRPRRIACSAFKRVAYVILNHGVSLSMSFLVISP